MAMELDCSINQKQRYMNTEIVKVNGTDIECPYENEQHFVAILQFARLWHTIIENSSNE
jgi:hypothetical protein